MKFKMFFIVSSYFVQTAFHFFSFEFEFSFHLYIYLPHSLETDGDAVLRVVIQRYDWADNYPNLLPEMPRYCCCLLVIFLFFGLSVL